MKKVLWIFVLIVAVFLFPACSGSYGGFDGAPSGADDSSDQADNGVSAGTLTAGEWNDNKHYDFFLKLFDSADPAFPEQSRDGVFAPYRDTWNLAPLDRIAVDVKAGGAPCAGATVTLCEGEREIATAVSDARGRAYLFPKALDRTGTFLLKTVYGDAEQTAPVTLDGEPILSELPQAANAFRALDLCFVVDTTGSMDDELEYLQAEIADVIAKVAQNNRNADIRLSLLFYRDEDDLYVTRKSDFSANISAQIEFLKKQNANGGGDYPEAVHTALEEALDLGWRQDACKLMFFVLDAPPHDTQEINRTFGNLVYRACARGVRIVPVAASGADTLTQYLMRSAATVTNGTYLFLTDDSGVGNAHDAPTVGEYTTEYLNACLVRVINELYTGIETAPLPIRPASSPETETTGNAE